jgi:hypothetical protein
MATAPTLPHLPIEVLVECSAMKGNGTEWTRFTDKGHLCTQHAQRLLGVRVKPSQIAGAGEGLIAADGSLTKAT